MIKNIMIFMLINQQFLANFSCEKSVAKSFNLNDLFLISYNGLVYTSHKMRQKYFEHF